MRLQITVSAVLAYVTAAATLAVPEGILQGYFPGRSGDVILQPDSSLAADDRFIFITDTATDQHFVQPSNEPVPATHVANIISRALGTQPLNLDDASPVAADPFHLAKANVVVTVESLGAAAVRSKQLPHLMELAKAAPIASELVSNVYPQGALSLATSIATGASPAAHGIVASSWEGEDGAKVEAFRDGINSAAQVASVADVLLQTFAGQSLVVSASGSDQQASVFGQNPQSRIMNVDYNSYVVAPTGDQGFAALGENGAEGKSAGSLRMTKDDVKATLADSKSVFGGLGADGVTATYDAADGGSLVLEYPSAVAGNTETATLHLDTAADYAFVSELAYLDALPGKLTADERLNQLVQDSTPDLVSFSFASLTGLVEKYGRDSNEVHAASFALDAALPRLMRQLTDLYPQQAVSELVLLGSHHSSTSNADTRQVASDLARLLPHEAASAEFFPRVYLRGVPAGDLADLCETMGLELERSHFRVFCPGVAHTRMLLESAVASASLAETSAATTLGVGNSTNPTSDEISEYHIELWVSVSLAFAAIAGAYAIGTMEFKKDPILFSEFNPAWDTAKTH